MAGLFGQEKISIGILNGPSAVPAAYLIENSSDYEFQIFSGADLEVPKLLKGEIDLGILPPNVAAKLYNKSNGNIVALSVIGQGNLSLLTTDPKYRNLKSLKGKTVYCAGRGATPEYIFRYILSKYPEGRKVNLDFSIPPSELAAALISGKAEYILVPEPFATVALMKGKDTGVRKVFDPSTSDEIKKEFSDANFPMTVLVCNKKSLETKNELISKYLEDYRAAVEWTCRNPGEAGELVEKHTLGLNAKIAAASIPDGRYCFISAQDSVPQIEKLLAMFLKENEESVGGKLPGKEFYFPLNK